MQSHESVISRAESGRVVPGADFIERYARAISRPITIVFGEPLPAPEERFERARRAYSGWLIQRHGRYFPDSADLIFRLRPDAEPAELYVAMLSRSDAGLESSFASHNDRWEKVDLRAATAVAAMYHEVIDWRQLRRRLPKSLRRLDERARRRARRIVAGID
jgi:hypothetical protein